MIGACTQLVEQGYEAFVMRELAESLGMKLGNLQYYFKTRESLVFHVIELEAAKDVQVIESHLQAGGSPMAAFSAVVNDLVTRWRGSTGVLFSTLTALSMHNTSFRQLYIDIYSRFYAALEKLVREVNPALSDEENKNHYVPLPPLDLFDGKANVEPTLHAGFRRPTLIMKKDFAFDADDANCHHENVCDWYCKDCQAQMPQFDCIFDDFQGRVSQHLKVCYENHFLEDFLHA